MRKIVHPILNPREKILKVDANELNKYLMRP